MKSQVNITVGIFAGEDAKCRGRFDHGIWIFDRWDEIFRKKAQIPSATRCGTKTGISAKSRKPFGNELNISYMIIFNYKKLSTFSTEFSTGIKTAPYQSFPHIMDNSGILLNEKHIGIFC